MTKQVEKTEGLIAELRRSVADPNLDTSTFAVFETRLISTEAVTQKGFHDGARLSRATLAEMSDFINTEGATLPLQLMHKTDLPVGRVFSSRLAETELGETELIGLFYIPNTDEKKTNLIADIESAIIDEVSVGVLTKHAFCSECNFDYFGDEANISHLWDLTCDEGHTIGEDGVHVRLVGLDTFAELSLVNRGAGKDAKIRSKDKHKIQFSQESIKRLAASGMPVEAHYFSTTSKLTNQMVGDKDMPGIEVAEFAAINKSLGKAEVELSQANTEIDKLKASLETKTTELKEAVALQETGLTELKASKEKVDAELKSVSDLVSGDLKAALVASGEAEDKVPTELPAMLAMIKEKGLKLHQLFGAGESLNQKDDVVSDADKLSAARRKATFKINNQY